LDKKNNSKLADFGVSKLISSENDNYLTPQVGSFFYMSPEIKAGNNYNCKTDIW